MSMNSQLTSAEEQLIRWMLEHGNSDARAFLPQRENVHATPFRCGISAWEQSGVLPGLEVYGLAGVLAII